MFIFFLSKNSIKIAHLSWIRAHNDTKDGEHGDH